MPSPCDHFSESIPRVYFTQRVPLDQYTYPAQSFLEQASKPNAARTSKKQLPLAQQISPSKLKIDLSNRSEYSVLDPHDEPSIPASPDDTYFLYGRPKLQSHRPSSSRSFRLKDMLARFEEQESEKQERLRRMRYESHVKQEEAIDQ